MSMLNTGVGQIGGFAVGRSVVGCLHNGADELMYAYLEHVPRVLTSTQVSYLLTREIPHYFGVPVLCSAFE